MADPKPAYLVQGDDDVRIDGWRARVRKVAAEEPEATIEVFPPEAPAADVAGALCSMTLGLGRRWLLVEGVERWKEKDVKVVSEALAGLPGDTTAVLVASGKVERKGGPAPAKLVAAVEKAGGEVKTFSAPATGRYAQWAADQGAKLGLELTPDAAQALADRVGETEDRRPRLRERRLVRELEKIAIYGPEEGRVDLDTVAELTAADAEARVYELGDALLDGDTARAIRLAEDLRQRGTDMMHIVYTLLRKVRDMRRAWALVEEGASTQEVAAALRVPPFVAKRIASEAKRADGARLERLATALADLDYAVRGGTNVDAGTELTLLVAGAERAER